jgi:hypothetical protein
VPTLRFNATMTTIAMAIAKKDGKARREKREER